MKIRTFKLEDQAAVIALWQRCGLTRPWNDPVRDIERKCSEDPTLFLVGTDQDGGVMASAMVGFDGHRGWLYYLTVDPEHQRQGYGRALIEQAERLLIERGCPKLMLMVRRGQSGLEDYYRALGFEENEVVTMGKRLIEDD
ncbi:GNAT family acetyltransferase [Kushneria indalinina]|uniref:Ribosomal protein S18 acetylase RimI-like enzyme n=1 Tax=Kushneria indalinina DSM 14324 TaxID=1122140 RepID=A0A3D9DUD0_9GAMM|nr:GNAT family acetyltransferase [Kushneria indalinina]REC94373.1 ribosomal protein S18 acetylase RimI-like enzyme [Kushneria indalinina DSM 14324]